jgi:hypothetical protein
VRIAEASVSEFEIPQLLIATRWEFDVTNLFFIVLSAFFVALGIFKEKALEPMVGRALQLGYVVVSLFLWLRTYAAIVRGQNLGRLLAELDPVFQIANPALQQPTWYLRIATFVVMGVVTLYVLDRAIVPIRGSQPGSAL